MAGMDSATLFMLAGVAIVIGYLANLLFRRYKAPDILMIMLFGWVVGPSVLGIISVDMSEVVGGVLPYVSSLALAFIMFDGGRELRLLEIGRVGRMAMLLSLVGFSLVVISLSLFFLMMLHLPLLMAIMAGVVFGSTSAPTVIPLIMSMGCSSRLKVLLTLESAMTDVLVVGIGTAFVMYLVSPASGAMGSLMMLLTSVLIATVSGVLAGVIWMYLTPTLKKYRYFYILTLAAILLLFSFCEVFAPAGGGVIAVLVFGLVLGNADHFPHLPYLRDKDVSLGGNFQVLNEETAFFIKVFFFTFLGIYVSTLNIGLGLLFYGLVVFIILLVIRQVLVHILRQGAEWKRSELLGLRTMFPRGLCTVVTAILPFTFGVAEGITEDTLLGIVALVIIGTTILTSTGAWLMERQLKNECGPVEGTPEEMQIGLEL